MERKPIIEFHDYSWQYNAQTEPTLHNLNFTIYEGEKILIAGPSGCGKSTIAHVINGLIPFSYRGSQTGTVTICGKETSQLSLFDISKLVGTVLQDADGQFVGLTVAEDIAFALENDNVGQDELFSRVAAAASEVEVSHVLHHAPNELSGGQKQRVSLAGVMVDHVPILLFDEPLANLDPYTGKQAIELIDEIHKKTGATILIIEHRLEDVLHRDIDRVLLLKEGRLFADMPPAELLSSNLLIEEGIREPLYISALKKAGVRVHPGMHPDRLDQLSLTAEEAEKVRSWFRGHSFEASAGDPAPLLDASAINFSYKHGEPVIRDITTHIHRGEMLSIVGTNGAGKSTFSKLICGFEQPQSGRFTLFAPDGTKIDLSGLSIKERADHIGYVMQNPNQMISKIMIMDEVGLGISLRKTEEKWNSLSETEIREHIEHTLRICGLYPMRNWPVSALSYGQKKRVTIASILALKPEILILDEPTAGQDYRHYTEIMEFLTELNRNGVTIIMVTHDMHLMLEYCSRSIVFSNGEVIMDASPAEVLTNDHVIERASLKRTSLYDMASRCSINEAQQFVRCFIEEERGHGVGRGEDGR